MDLKKALKQISTLGTERDIYTQIRDENAGNARACDEQVAKIKADILQYMQENGVKQDQVEEEVVTILVTLMDGKESVDCPEIDAVPEEFIKTTRAVDKKAVADHIKESPLPNWCTMKTGKPFIQVKSVIK